MFRIRQLFSMGESAAKHGDSPRSEPTIRAMEESDLECVHAIELASEPNAWSKADLARWRTRANSSSHVVEESDELCAFFIVCREKQGLHLANLAVAPAHRRRGIGRHALGAIENIARAFGLPRIVLEVREENLAAQLLYRAIGFRAVEILRDHYKGEDGYRMVKPVPSALDE